MDLGEVVQDLRRPFSPDAVRFKIQALTPKNAPKRAQIVAYIDARLAAERLTAVIPEGWEDAYVPSPVGQGLECRLTVLGVTRADVGFSGDVSTDMGLKALYSDAFKRAAVKFGVGASLYALPKLVVPVEQLTMWNNKPYLFDDSPALASAHESYGEWLANSGTAHFGAILDHGDAEGAQGDIETEPVQEGEATDKLSDMRGYAAYLRQAIRVYDDTELADEEEFLALVEAHEDHAQLRKLLESLTAALKDAGGDPKLVAQRWEATRHATA